VSTKANDTRPNKKFEKSETVGTIDSVAQALSMEKQKELESMIKILNKPTLKRGENDL
jgi:hypothetical protein